MVYTKIFFGTKTYCETFQGIQVGNYDRPRFRESWQRHQPDALTFGTYFNTRVKFVLFVDNKSFELKHTFPNAIPKCVLISSKVNIRTAVKNERVIICVRIASKRIRCGWAHMPPF